jgi:hypothetical protein
MNENINTKNLNSNFKNREKFKFNIENRLKILQERQINPDNIFDFYDDFLNGLIDISEQVLNRYIKEERVPTKKDREKGIQEDEAFKYFNLDSISEIINKMSGIIHERSSRLEDIKEEIVSRSHIEKRLFVPPDRDDKYIINVGNGGGIEEKRNIPRLLTLIYILENDLDLNLEDHKDITINKGINEENMMRKESYIRVLIPELNRIVYICDEEGNASFVFDRNSIKEKNLSAFELDNYTKINFNELIENNKNIGVKITQSKNWRERMLTALTKDISEFEKKKSQVRSDLETKEDVPLKKEGWENKHLLSRRLGFSNFTVGDFAEQFRISNPEWFEIQKTRMHISEYYHPELIKLIEEKFNAISDKKEGWENASSLSFIIFGHVANLSRIRDAVEPYRKDHPEWFEKQKSGIKTVEHYSPGLVKIILENLKNKNVDWETPSHIAKEVIGYSSTNSFLKIKNIAETYRKDHPEWFEQRDRRYFDNKKSEYYHPDLIKIIKEHLNAIPNKKEGWQNVHALAEIIKSVPLTIKSFAEQFRETNPEWFEQQRNKTQTAEYYHPELVKIIKDHFSKKTN